MHNFIFRILGVISGLVIVVLLVRPMVDGRVVRASPRYDDVLVTPTAIPPTTPQLKQNGDRIATVKTVPRLDNITYSVIDRLVFAPPLAAAPNNTCDRFRDEPLFYDPELTIGSRCVYDLDAAPLATTSIWSGIADDDCYSARLAQAACRQNARIEAGDSAETRASYCGQGFEVNCQRHMDAILSAIIEHDLPVYRTPDTLCAGTTVNGIGYSDYATFDYQIDEQCLLTQRGFVQRRVWCEFLGENITVVDGFCQALTTCVEPALLERYPIVGTTETGNWLFDFPSGAQALDIELSCSHSAVDGSLHRYENYCRAIDINVHDNYGNLTRGSKMQLATTMPPEFVAIMANCGVIWGGYYDGAQDVWQGCDPMEFAYAPACIVQ
ncbi:MAG: hypothetical protein M9965_12700 [Anaerolineae bacterium]|nr:hypothetical protein [Anaerolineae bacterium]